MKTLTVQQLRDFLNDACHGHEKVFVADGIVLGDQDNAPYVDETSKRYACFVETDNDVVVIGRLHMEEAE